MRAIVIGAGPSLSKNNHLEQLAKSDFNDTIIVTDKMLLPCLEYGITPDKYKKYVVCTLEEAPIVPSYFNDELVGFHAPTIKCYYSNRTTALETIINAGFTQRVKMNDNLTLDTHNVGCMALMAGIFYENCTDIALIGIDCCCLPSYVVLDKTHPNFYDVYKEVINDKYMEVCYLDPIFEMYREDFIYYAHKYKGRCRVSNCTEGGALFSDDIEQKTFSEWLNESKHDKIEITGIGKQV